MELHQLRYLVAVSRTGSFSRAAAHCHVAQPSLSQQIQKLEEELGEPLFRRSSKGALLTPAGEVLVARAGRILREVEDARGEIRDSSEGLRGSISIGVIPTIAPYFLPPVLECFARAYPDVELVIHEDTTAQLELKVAQMEIDLAVASLPLDERRFAVRSLFEEELVLAVPSTHSLARRKRISLASLDGERFILMKEGHCLGTQALNLCHKAHLTPNVALRSAQIETIHSLVAAGFGISLIPQMAVPDHGRKEPVFRSLEPPVPSRTIAVFHHKEAYLNRATLRLLEMLLASAPSRRSTAKPPPAPK
jgi:LysR family hydrogen peroxide-inducible transcriptional activator